MHKTRQVHPDEGLGMIEVLVSLMILALLAIAVLPTFANALTSSSANIARTTATQLVSKELNTVRTVESNCVSIQNHGSDPLGLLWTDPRGTVLEIHRVAQGSCPTLYPALIDYRVYVTQQGSTDVIAEASTRIYVASQSDVAD
jgi:type II secretory pathway pseudopilin PulG